MYDLNAYGRMMADSVRMKAYTTALREAINPHSVVLEIGTGAGIFALLACQYGAKRVYAIEPSDVISVARAAAVANGYADRIIFLQDYSTNIMLPERADIILSDLRGTLPYFHTNVTSLIDARQRFLAPGGRLIPQDDSLQVGVVSAPELYRHYTAPWDEHGQKLDWQVARRAVLNTSHLGRVKPEQILMSAQCGSALDYTSVVNPNFKGKVSWTAEQAGTAHGLIVWFETTLVEGIRLSGAPGNPELVYGNAFFPWLQPTAIAAGDSVSVTLQADLVGKDYVWRWESSVLDQGKPDQIKANFKQSDFFGRLWSPKTLRKMEAGYTPTLNEAGQIQQFILEQMDGTASLDEIAHQVSIQFPRRIANQQEALTIVREMSRKFGN